MIAPNSIEQLLTVAAIEEVVGDYVSLKRAGSRYKGLCPFHDEKTPSFVVSPTIGIYKCFGCQKGGNSINFLMEMENYTYVEAARSLAAKYGVELIETGKEDTDAFRASQKQRENIQVVLDFALDFFRTNLFESEEGKNIGLPYFKER
jgi:DNA primase